MEDSSERVTLSTYPTEVIAHVVAARLGAEGVKNWVTLSQSSPAMEEGSFGVRPNDVMVRRTDLARAIDILKLMREENGSVDWDAVDVGQPEDSLGVGFAKERNPLYATHMGIAGVITLVAILIGAISTFGFLSMVLLLGAAVLAMVTFVRMGTRG